MTLNQIATPTTRSAIGTLAVAAVLALSACGSSSSTDTASSPAAAASVAASSSSETASTSSADASSAMKTVNPNTATKDQIASALSANGVKNADKWTAEIVEYKEAVGGNYTAANLAPTLTKNLAKYNVSADQLKLLLATLNVS